MMHLEFKSLSQRVAVGDHKILHDKSVRLSLSGNDRKQKHHGCDCSPAAKYFPFSAIFGVFRVVVASILGSWLCPVENPECVNENRTRESKTLSFLFLFFFLFPFFFSFSFLFSLLIIFVN